MPELHIVLYCDPAPDEKQMIAAHMAAVDALPDGMVSVSGAHVGPDPDLQRRLTELFESEIRWRSEAERLADALGLIANGRWNVDTDKDRDVHAFARHVLSGRAAHGNPLSTEERGTS